MRAEQICSTCWPTASLSPHASQPEGINASGLVSESIASEAEIDAMNAEIKDDAAAAVEYALNAKYPDVSEVDMHVFTDVTHALAQG